MRIMSLLTVMMCLLVAAEAKSTVNEQCTEMQDPCSPHQQTMDRLDAMSLVMQEMTDAIKELKFVAKYFMNRVTCSQTSPCFNVHVYERYLLHGISGYNSYWAPDTSSIRACFDQCAAKVSNLKSIDYHIHKTACACQPVDKNDAPMIPYTDYDTYQYFNTVNGGELFVQDGIADSAMNTIYSKVDQVKGKNYAILIVEPEMFDASTRQKVSSGAECADLCNQQSDCNAYILQWEESGGLCTLTNNIE